ncbi:D-alanyl-D-alanine carboxypeptidase family protein [Parerythrobacter aestuarii]|uniref:D-alanyl-D-alanine carboxypeptidase family protein n=1 Tax=Parerythrobacter aestuarii TaxID=3020909 RepID=UPI0024DDFE1B|nr:D-alanyl-D-alanine carboxypeptidase family protein [Parerythrobacter aestuarii]
MKAFFGKLAAMAALALAVPATASPAPVPDTVPIAMLVDLSSGQVLFARNADRRFVPASITKAMTVYTAFDLLARGKLQPEQSFTFSETAAEEWRRTGSTMFLEPGDETTVRNLLLGVTTVSANDGAIVLAEGAAGSVARWLELMNANARRLGMTQSHFGTPNGFPDGARTFTTARDLVTLGRALTLEHAELYQSYFGRRGLVTNGFAQSNHDPLTGRVAGADGIKTGFTRQAGNGFLGSAERDGRRLVLVVAGVAEQDDRDDAARALMEWGFATFTSRQLFGKGATVGEAQVQDGTSDTVKLVAASPIRFAMPRATDRPVKLSVRYEGPLRAPIAAGEAVAELQISVEGMEPSLVPLLAAEPVERAGFLGRIANALKGLLS